MDGHVNGLGLANDEAAPRATVGDVGAFEHHRVGELGTTADVGVASDAYVGAEHGTGTHARAGTDHDGWHPFSEGSP